MEKLQIIFVPCKSALILFLIMLFIPLSLAVAQNRVIFFENGREHNLPTVKVTSGSGNIISQNSSVWKIRGNYDSIPRNKSDEKILFTIHVAASFPFYIFYNWDDLSMSDDDRHPADSNKRTTAEGPDSRNDLSSYNFTYKVFFYLSYLRGKTSGSLDFRSNASPFFGISVRVVFFEPGDEDVNGNSNGTFTIIASQEISESVQSYLDRSLSSGAKNNCGGGSMFLDAKYVTQSDDSKRQFGCKFSDGQEGNLVSGLSSNIRNQNKVFGPASVEARKSCWKLCKDNSDCNQKDLKQSFSHRLYNGVCKPKTTDGSNKSFHSTQLIYSLPQGTDKMQEVFRTLEDVNPDKMIAITKLDKKYSLNTTIDVTCSVAKYYAGIPFPLALKYRNRDKLEFLTVTGANGIKGDIRSVTYTITLNSLFLENIICFAPVLGTYDWINSTSSIQVRLPKAAEPRTTLKQSTKTTTSTTDSVKNSTVTEETATSTTTALDIAPTTEIVIVLEATTPRKTLNQSTTTTYTVQSSTVAEEATTSTTTTHLLEIEPTTEAAIDIEEHENVTTSTESVPTKAGSEGDSGSSPLAAVAYVAGGLLLGSLGSIYGRRVLNMVRRGVPGTGTGNGNGTGTGTGIGIGRKPEFSDDFEKNNTFFDEFIPSNSNFDVELDNISNCDDARSDQGDDQSDHENSDVESNDEHNSTVSNDNKDPSENDDEDLSDFDENCSVEDEEVEEDDPEKDDNKDDKQNKFTILIEFSDLKSATIPRPGPGPGPGPGAARSILNGIMSKALKNVDVEAGAGGLFGFDVVAEAKNQLGAVPGTADLIGSTLNNLTVAKRVQRNVDEAYFKAFVADVKKMTSLKAHPNVVQFLGATEDQLTQSTDSISISMEFCQNGNLLKTLQNLKASQETRSSPIKSLRSSERLKLLTWCHEIATGMKFLHSQKIIHGDLSARNVLLTSENVSKISEFGHSRQLLNDFSIYKQEKCYKWKWRAFESLETSKFSTESDVWSFGVTLWEIFSLGDSPYPGQVKCSKQFMGKLRKGLRPTKPYHAQINTYEIMVKCWDKNPKQRPIFSALSKQLDKNIQD